MAASVYHVTSNEEENRIFKHSRIFKHMYLELTYIDKVVELYSYLRYSDRLFDMFFLRLAVILLEFHEKPRRQDWVPEKNYKEEFVVL